MTVLFLWLWSWSFFVNWNLNNNTACSKSLNSHEHRTELGSCWMWMKENAFTLVLRDMKDKFHSVWKINKSLCIQTPGFAFYIINNSSSFSLYSINVGLCWTKFNPKCTIKLLKGSIYTDFIETVEQKTLCFWKKNIINPVLLHHS
jgi:hypothetical protein